MKIRQDAWSEEDDLLLAETVLRHVREGSTQLNAFEEVGDKLNRTSAACGFRWNAVVRHTYDKALQLAKKQRKQRQRMLGREQAGKKRLLYTPPSPTIEDVGLPAIEIEHISEIKEIQDSELLLPQLYMEPISAEQSLSVDMVISYLHTLRDSALKNELVKSENERLKLELKELKQQNLELHKKVEHLEQNSGLMQEDYETLMKIMNRARKLVLLEEDDRSAATKFKMDRNGNLEKLAEYS
jgi:prespore-specific regulator